MKNTRKKSYLIKNGNIYDVHKGKLLKKDIFIKNGIISKISKSIDLSADEIIDASGKQVFPGFIDAHSHIGSWTDTKDLGNDCNECVDPVTPTMRVIDGTNPVDPCFKEAVSAGFTCMMITPGSGNVVCGQAAIIKPIGKTIQDMTVNPFAALKIALGENPKSVYSPLNRTPKSRMATAYILENYFTQAIEYLERKGKVDTDKDYSLEPCIPVINREIPLKIHAHRADDICTAMKIAEKFNLRYTLDHCTEGRFIKEQIRNANVPVIVGPIFMFRTKIELANASYKNMIDLVENGVSVSYSSDHHVVNTKYLALQLGVVVNRGLPYNEAIKSLTINPAKALEISHKVGSIEVGKDADLAIYDGDPLECTTNNHMTFINGELVYTKL